MASKKNNPTRTGNRVGTEYSSDTEFVKEATRLFNLDVSSNEHNTEPEKEDMRFVLGDQWDADVKRRRARQKKPTLTINRLPAFVAQYVGSQLQNDTTIKLVPSRGGSKEVASLRQGLIRTTMRTNTAKLALQKAMETSYICGVGNFAVEVVDSENDVFIRDIKLKSIADPHAVIWDRASKDPTGADANHCFVMDFMTKDDFKATYPDHATDSGFHSDIVDNTVSNNGYEVEEMVRVAQFWQMKREPVMLALESGTGDVINVTGWDEEKIRLTAEINDQGAPIVRKTVQPYAECYVITSSNVLEGPFRLDIPRLPVFRVEGWTLQENATRYRWGFVRNAKDPQRIHNFWRSTLAEELMKSPAAKWLLDRAGMKTGDVDKFRRQHRDGDTILSWDSQSGGAKPEFVPPPQMNSAVLTEAQMSVSDIRDVTNRHEASMGKQSNEVSGKAISARQRVSELGDVTYINNMNMSISEAGKVMNALIPAVYDTARTIKITGDDDEELLQAINGDMGDETPDITKGKYDLTYTTGPSYATKRQESVDLMMTLMNTMPQMGNVLADIIVRNMDVPGAEEIEERLATLLPPGMINPERLPPARKKRVLEQMERAKEEAGQQSQMQQVQFMKAIEKLTAEIGELKARTMKQEASALKEVSEIGVDMANVDVAQDKVELDGMKVGLQLNQGPQEMFKTGLDMATAFDAAQKQATQETPPDGKNDQSTGNSPGPSAAQPGGAGGPSE